MIACHILFLLFMINRIQPLDCARGWAVGIGERLPASSGFARTPKTLNHIGSWQHIVDLTRMQQFAALCWFVIRRIGAGGKQMGMTGGIAFVLGLQRRDMVGCVTLYCTPGLLDLGYDR